MIAVSGCATTSSGPVPAGENTWTLTRQEGAFPSGSEPLLEEALAESRQFCSNMRRSFNLVDTYQNAGPYIMGNYPKATITFKCIDASNGSDSGVVAEGRESGDLYSEILKLDDLRQRGLITDEEYEQEKKELLDEN